MTPVHRLAFNAVTQFYLGGARLVALRDPARPYGADDGALRQPEEWLGSTVARWGSDGVGLTALADGRLLRDAVAADPEHWLGCAHAACWGDSPALLVKLLDAGERLPVHVHPTRTFAAGHLGCPFGKTEAWVVVDTPAEGGTVFVGANRPVAADEWAAFVAAQDTATMLGLLNDVSVGPGDAVLVPAGTPHAIDEGLLVVELQEPTDFSILLEWDGFAVDGPTDGHLGLGFDVALGAVRRDAVDPTTLDALIRRADESSSALPAAADPYFRAWRVRAGSTVPAAFSVVVVLEGTGALRAVDGECPLAGGDAYVIPHAAGPLTFTGDLTAIVCQPPDAAAPDPVEVVL